MKIRQDFKNDVEKYINKYVKILDISQYKIKVEYEDEDVTNTDEGDSNTETKIEIDITRRYLEAEIIIYPTLIKEWEEDNSILESYIVHELSHILVDHLQSLVILTYKTEREVNDAVEMLTEHISRLALKLNTIN